MGFFAGFIYVFNLAGGLGAQRFLTGFSRVLRQDSQIFAMTLDSFSLFPLGLSPLNVLAVLAVLLLVGVTGGVIYLTAVEWRDRRRQDREKRSR
jgi:hypothetical protein